MLFFTNYANTSSNPSRFPITPTSAWRIDFNHSFDSINGNEVFKYHIDGDTTINNLKYFKLYKTGVAYYDKPLYIYKLYIGAIRDADNKFFFVDKKKTSEVLLYDFNLKAGDTIHTAIANNETIFSINTLLDGRKVFHLSFSLICSQRYIIEGIGNDGGLLEDQPCVHVGMEAYFLVCYSENGNLIYHGSYSGKNNCDIVDINPSRFQLNNTFTWRINSLITYPNYEYFLYFLNKDTFINSVKYQKLYKSGYQSELRIFYKKMSPKFYDSVYVGAVRSSDNKYYFIEKNNSQEKLLYDFNLKAGDIIKGTVGYGDTVKKVDTLLDNRKIFFLSQSNWENMIIEGIGSTNGFLENINSGSYLVCFTENKVPVYYKSSDTECKLSFSKIYPQCDNISELTSGNEVKLIVTSCYQYYNKDVICPTLVDNTYSISSASIRLDLYYKMGERGEYVNQMTICNVIDTISIGTLENGKYDLTYFVHNINNGGNPDTSFNNKYNRVFLTVSQPVYVTASAGQDKVIMYPVPATDFIMVEYSNIQSDIATVEIYNYQGIKILKEE